ncbi:MAG: MFS transporter [Clostridia bacterium]|nr:MFS transporter [Clostridia bacterium]
MSASYKSTKIACFAGFVVQAIINNFLPLLFIIFNTRYNLNYEQLGRLLFINFFVQLIVDALTPAVVKHIGYRGAAIACHGLAAVGLCLLGILPLLFPKQIYTCVIIAIIIYATGSGIIEVCISPIVEMLPGDKKGADMAFSHSFYCWGQAFTVLVSTILIYLIGQDGWQLIPIIWAVIPFVNMFNFMRVPIVEQVDEPVSKTAKALFKNRDFWIFAIIMICAGASEITMAEWASIFTQQALGVSKTVGDLLGPCAFAICMGSGRVIFGLFDGKFNPKKALIINNILCVICYVGVAVCSIEWLSLVACALCGFTVSLSWPGTYSMAARYFPTGGTLMFSLLALCGDFGCSIGPWTMGIVANSTTLQMGFLVCAIFPAIMVVTAPFLRKEKC